MVGSLGATLGGVTFPVPHMFAPVYYASYLFPVRHLSLIHILIIFCLLLPLAVQAKREKVDMPDKPVVSDSILQCLFQFSPFYSRIIDEYKAFLLYTSRCV